MRIIDARSGREMKVGDIVQYPGGGATQLLDARVGLWAAKVRIRTDWHGAPGGYDDRWVDAIVRYTHPSFFLEKIVFIPS